MQVVTLAALTVHPWFTIISLNSLKFKHYSRLFSLYSNSSMIPSSFSVTNSSNFKHFQGPWEHCKSYNLIQCIKKYTMKFVQQPAAEAKCSTWSRFCFLVTSHAFLLIFRQTAKGMINCAIQYTMLQSIS